MIDRFKNSAPNAERQIWGRLPTGRFHFTPDSDSGLTMSRYDLTDFEWRVIEPLLPTKPRGMPRVDDRRVLNGIFWVLR